MELLEVDGARAPELATPLLGSMGSIMDLFKNYTHECGVIIRLVESLCLSALS